MKYISQAVQHIDITIVLITVFLYENYKII